MMKKALCFFVLQLLFAGMLCAQSDSLVVTQNDSLQQELKGTGSKPEGEIFSKPDVFPEFPDGMDALRSYIAQSIIYPRTAAKNKEQGRVFVQFVVETDGRISNVKIARGVSPDLNAEAIRVVKRMPSWSPGLKDGKPVRVSFTMPINFRLQ